MPNAHLHSRNPLCCRRAILPACLSSAATTAWYAPCRRIHRGAS